MTVKFARATPRVLISLRQAKVIREMLRLGSFTVSQVAANTGEAERYIQNLICDETAVLKRLELLIPVENVRLGRAGAPAKVWAVDPEKQEEILDRISFHYGALETERRASILPEESVYRFISLRPQVASETDQRTYSTTISIQKRGDSVEVSAPVIGSFADTPGSQRNAIVVDTGKIANGLAALCQTRASSGHNVTAVVNFRRGEAHVVFLRQGVLQSFFSIKFQQETSDPWERAVNLSIADQYLVMNQLKSAVQLFEASSSNEKVNEVLITGNLRSPSGVSKIISAVLRVRCEFLDPIESLAFSSECVNTPQSRNLIMNNVPEIGYAFRRWQFEQQHEAVASSSKGRQSPQFYARFDDDAAAKGSAASEWIDEIPRAAREIHDIQKEITRTTIRKHRPTGDYQHSNKTSN